MNWNWDHLRFFLALANAGSLSQAARELGVSHTTVLRRVRAIEQSLETHLFDHTAQGQVLTPAGQALHAEVQKMKLAVDDIARQISGVDQKIQGPVSITTTDTLGHYILPGVITRLQQQHPELSIHLRVANQLSDISGREADIALRPCVEPPPSLIGRKVATLAIVPCAAKSYAREFNIARFPVSTAGHRFIVLEDGDANYRDWLANRVDAGCARISADGMLSACQLCLAGAGIALLPDYLVGQNPQLVALDVSAPVASKDLWLLSHVDMRDTRRIRLVKRFLSDELARVFGD